MPRADWIGSVEGPPPPRVPWEYVAATEHASIASFARVSLELLALGAPPELLRDTLLAALDEIEHARFAYAMASAVSARDLGPRPLPEAIAPLATPTLSFARLARRTFLDACLGETIGACMLQRRAQLDGDPRLSRIGDDEERHADLAWRTLAWAVRAGGEEAERALEQALEQVHVKDDEERTIAEDVVFPCARALLLERRANTPT